MTKVSVSGLGKAGLPLCAVLAEAGHTVYGVDVSPQVVEKINKGQCPVSGEPGLPEALEKHGGKNIQATTNAKKAAQETDVHIIIVPLFLDENHKPDYKNIDEASEKIGQGLKKGDLVVLETTVPVGTTKGRLKNKLEALSGLKAGQEFHLAYSPERIMTGYSLDRFKRFPKIVGGLDDKSTEKAHKFYSSFCENVSKATDTETAEYTKIIEGVYRDVNIALANELFKTAETLGIDFWEAREAANHKYCEIHEAGLGVGGHCIPVYPHFLIDAVKDAKQKAVLTKTARDINESMAQYFSEKIIGGKQGTPGKCRVAVIGLTYREGVDETHNTPSKKLIQLLKKEGCKVYGVDPLIPSQRIEDEFGVEAYEGEDFNEFDFAVLVNKEEKYLEALNAAENVSVIYCKNQLKK
ncbi:MAG: nucleotide sugar dehydrogenase [Candidatus Altiarchaeales archaeon]|nr:nucleotide sugar dehydrogenase [Candidatus Altiarchaeales archaeon]